MTKVISNETARSSGVDVSRYHGLLSQPNKLVRVVWVVLWALLFQTSPRTGVGFEWWRFPLRLFGAHAARTR